MMKKGFIVLVVFRFIGLAYSPIISANVNQHEERVDFDIELCGLGKKHTVQLTKQEADEVELLFDEIQTKLDGTESREETEEIFKEAIINLDKYGLLGGLSVKQAQRLVTGTNQNPKYMNILEKLTNRNHGTLNYEQNYLILIAGRTDETFFFGGILRIAWGIYLSLPQVFAQAFYSGVIAPLLALCMYKPFFIGTDVIISNGMGWIWTLGLLGVQSWNGQIAGYFPSSEPNTAVVRFRGIKILLNADSYNNFYLGSAMAIRITVDE